MQWNNAYGWERTGEWKKINEQTHDRSVRSAIDRHPDSELRRQQSRGRERCIQR